MFWFSSRNNKPVQKGWEGIAPGLNDPVQIGHAGMAKGEDKFSRCQSMAFACSVNSFFFFFVLEFFSQTFKYCKIIFSAVASL